MRVHSPLNIMACRFANSVQNILTATRRTHSAARLVRTRSLTALEISRDLQTAMWASHRLYTLNLFWFWLDHFIQFCHNRPKHFDGTKTHDFCSKACAKNALPQRKSTGGGWTTGLSNNAQSTNHVANQNTSGVCQAPGCTNPPHMGYDYCSLAHKTSVFLR